MTTGPSRAAQRRRLNGGGAELLHVRQPPRPRHEIRPLACELVAAIDPVPGVARLARGLSGVPLVELLANLREALGQERCDHGEVGELGAGLERPREQHAPTVFDELDRPLWLACPDRAGRGIARDRRPRREPKLLVAAPQAMPG